jgi:hypothetical protein
VTLTNDWAARIAAAEAEGMLRHAGLLFLKTDKAPPQGRQGPVWADSHGLGLWVVHRESMVLVERRR